MKSVNYISNKKLIFRIVLILLFVSILFILLSTFYIKKAALNTLAQDDAKKTSELVFETMNTRMQEGWGKEDLQKILDRLEYIRKGMHVASYRSKLVEEILGEVPHDKQKVENDPFIQKAMNGKEQFIVLEDNSIRFLYPIRVSQECITCHYNTNVGDINGVLDISYPPSDIKISLDMMTYYFIGFFIVFILVFIYLFFFVINKKMVVPIVEFTNEIQNISQKNDLSLRANVNTNIEEIGSLQNSFNQLLKTTKYYYDKLIDSLFIDSLTKVPNFIKLQQDIQKIVKPFGFVLIDIQNFKQLNNFYGIDVGDYVLKELAQTLQHLYKNEATLYRINADRFAYLFDKNIDIDAVKKIIQSIHEMKFTIQYSDITIKIRASLLNDEKQHTVEKAELALELAKKTRQDCIAYDKSLHLEDKYMQHILWTNKIEEALKNEQFVPYFQPIKSVASGKFEKYETLVRLVDNDEVYTPDYFLEVSIQANSYPQITQMLIEKAFEYFEQNDLGIKFSLNLAFEDILNKTTTSLLLEKLKNYKQSQNVIIELLETQEISDYDILNDFINQIKQFGAKIAIDDFGSGYSNFNYILKLNIDIVKLDSSLIENIDNDKQAYTVVKNVTQTLQKLGFEVIAEKVHSAEIEKILTEIGVDYLQGYHIGKPTKNIINQ